MASGGSIRFELTRESQGRFSRLIRAVASATRKRMSKLLYEIAGFYLQSARRATPLSRRARPIRRLSRRDLADQQSAFGKRLPWAVLVYSNRSDRPRRMWKFYPNRSKAERKRAIPSRGAGRASWSGMLRRIGKASSESSYSGLRAYAANIVRRIGGDGQRQALELENKLGYIAKAVPGIARDSLLKAQNRFANRYLDREIGDAIRRQWKAA